MSGVKGIETDIYKTVFRKSVVHVIKYVNFQLCRAYSDRVIWEN